MSNKIDHEKHLANWKEKYNEELKDEEKNDFTEDGPIDWDIWVNQKPKIMFLLKEAYGGGSPKEANVSFSQNVVRWKYVVEELYKDIEANMNYDIGEELSNYHDAIKQLAFVEVKKLDEGNTKTDDKEILKYAKRDRELLKLQIELIDPQIILCGNTGDAYGDCIYIDEEWEPLSSIAKCNTYKHRNRLVIDFWHPTQWGARPEQYFYLLCSLLKEGNVFESFDWAKQSK